jgi:alpha-methylacyl-CoA racemase
MGVLSGYRIIELAGLGPCPMAGMLLADMGAEVIVVDRGPISDPLYAKDMSRRGKKSIVINLKTDEGRETLLALIASADALLEGYRPGVEEKLGFGPEVCHRVNPKLVYGRMTGWGQTGPLSISAGHDINYIALSGALHAVSVAGEKPVPPVNLVGDFGGGAMFLVTGVLAALLEVKSSGEGQVVDAAMVDGSANLMWMCHSFHSVGAWDFDRPGTNLLDGGAFFYDTYLCSDGKYVALGAIEPQFFAEFVALSGVDSQLFSVEAQMDQARWPQLKAELAKVFKTKTRDEWADVFAGSDACCSPVLNSEEAVSHPQGREREAYETVDGYSQPAPAPRFSRTPSLIRHGRHQAGQDSIEVLRDLGQDQDVIDDLLERGAVKTN